MEKQSFTITGSTEYKGIHEENITIRFVPDNTIQNNSAIYGTDISNQNGNYQAELYPGIYDVEIDQITISAINSLLEGLEIKEIDLKNLYRILTKDSDVLKIDDFKAKIESYLDDMIKAENVKNVRLKIKNIKDE